MLHSILEKGFPMKNKVFVSIQLMVVLALFPVLAIAGGDETLSVEEKINGLQTMCTETADARTERQAAKSLYDRLGGYDRIHALTTEIVRLHQINPDFRLMMKYVDGEHLATGVADFIAAGTGGTEHYKGRNMLDAHSHLDFTDADFLSAGGDVGKAMQNLGYGQEETNEVICILVSLQDQVVLK
jgi:hemoglobin